MTKIKVLKKLLMVMLEAHSQDELHEWEQYVLLHLIHVGHIIETHWVFLAFG